MPSTKTKVMINAQNIVKNYGDVKVLKGVSLQIHENEVIAIIGPSGSGKSTLLRCLNHLEVINQGHIDINGRAFVSTDEQGHCTYVPTKEIRSICASIGMVFQQFNLFPHMTVLDNLLEAPMTVKGMKRAEILPIAEALLEKVGLLDKRDNYPSQLSGGQKQRVAIARALAMEPQILLFDEPTSALDPELTGEVLRTIRDLAREDMTMVVVTHEMAFAREVANTVYFMDQGVIAEGGEAHAFFDNPQNERTQAFLGRL